MTTQNQAAPAPTAALPAPADLLTYVDPSAPRLKRAVVRGLENALGRKKLVRQVEGLVGEPPKNMTFWSWAVSKLKFSYSITHGSLEALPKEGPVIFVANHPFGVADGLILADLLEQTYGDFRILTHAVLCKLPQTSGTLVPIRFDSHEGAMRENARVCAQMARFAREGGAIGLFPSGTVSTSNTAMGDAFDPVWKSYVAKLAQQSGARVVPIYFEGQNSRLFHIVSQVSDTLRNAMFLYESRRLAKHVINVRIGKAIEPEELTNFEDRAAMTAYLRQRLYEVGGKPNAPVFEPKIF